MDDESNDIERHGSEQEDTEEPPPFQDLVERIRAGDDEVVSNDSLSQDSDLDTAGFFQDESVEQFDTEALWTAIESDGQEMGELSDFRGGETDHVVPKQWYCEQCEHFSEPPEVHCRHDGTTILEFVGTEDVRVRNCPVVAERKALGQFRTD